MCWGFNGINGQLGDGTTEDRPTPANVAGLGGRIVSIAVGYFHACALTASGGVKCWGSNAYGQLGNGTALHPEQHTAVDAAGLSGVVGISAGDNHTCAVTRQGGVKCWGENSAGQLGDGTTQRRLTPVDVVGLDSRAMMVSAGSAYTCAVTTAGAAKCWGDNREGNLGNGTTQARQLTPMDISGLNGGILQIAAGAGSTCALSTSGGAKCWGLNIFGRLGDGTTQNRLTPVDVIGLTHGVVAVSTGYAHACALTSVSGLKCWGSSSELGAGNLPVINQPMPVDIAGL
jgi:alpha-tubulin suppressor-like RCC1 family protein